MAMIGAYPESCAATCSSADGDQETNTTHGQTRRETIQQVLRMLQLGVAFATIAHFLPILILGPDRLSIAVIVGGIWVAIFALVLSLSPFHPIVVIVDYISFMYYTVFFGIFARHMSLRRRQRALWTAHMETLGGWEAEESYEERFAATYWGAILWHLLASMVLLFISAVWGSFRVWGIRKERREFVEAYEAKMGQEGSDGDTPEST